MRPPSSVENAVKPFASLRAGTDLSTGDVLEAVSKPGGRGSRRTETGQERGSAGASPSQRMVLKCVLVLEEQRRAVP